MHTPCKTIPPFPRLEIFLTGVPLQGPTPRWAEDLHRWIHEHGQHSPYGMCREFYNLYKADRALLIIIRHISFLDENAKASSSQILDVGATAEVTTAQFRRLDEDHD